MKALILNSGLGSRMGDLTADRPKCLVKIKGEETILSLQLKLLREAGIKEVVITTGNYEKDIINYCYKLDIGMEYTFVNNPISNKTNYIYSIYLAKEFLNDSIVMLHGDLVFDFKVLEGLLSCEGSAVAVSTTNPLPEKDFKAVIKGEYIEKIGVEFFYNSVECQPLYKLNQHDWNIWLKNISLFCENNNVKCYAENALNEVTANCNIRPWDFKDLLCGEVDTVEDLKKIKERLEVLDC